MVDVKGVATFIGGDAARAAWPRDAMSISLRLASGTFAIDGPTQTPTALPPTEVIVAVDRELCRTTFGIGSSAVAAYHLPTDMRVIALRILDCALPDVAKRAFHFAKSVELLCSISEKLCANELSATGPGDLSEPDMRRIVKARGIIDEHWQEKLTLASIARASGLNRAKLTRGFRSMFACSVADAITEQRMNSARDLILATDLPISCIGYRCGYLNNASFARAFSRRFGLAPTRLRADRVAA